MIEFVKDLLGFMADAAGHAEMQVGFVMAMGEVAQAALHTGSGVAMAMSEVGQAALHTGTSVLISHRPHGRQVEWRIEGDGLTNGEGWGGGTELPGLNSRDDVPNLRCLVLSVLQ
eukprot:g13979.t2